MGAQKKRCSERGGKKGSSRRKGVDASCDVGENRGQMETTPLLNHWRKETFLFFPLIKSLKVLNVLEWEFLAICHVVIEFYFKAISFLLQNERRQMLVNRRLNSLPVLEFFRVKARHVVLFKEY